LIRPQSRANAAASRDVLLHVRVLILGDIEDHLWIVPPPNPNRSTHRLQATTRRGPRNARDPLFARKNLRIVKI